ncbi:hypothetical protein SAMN06265219_11076 [Gracilimonas mengyeensis]|uniref:HTH araC/xylS-type domain-containing protein n=2 Tax=Gracilimonas mengyeensis TaxID=1302730 RepID=A0A521E1S7_9BACT|nr:hypothetical protein SAMN06265219_11076 [Gracilimonas mengyeensis]
MLYENPDMTSSYAAYKVGLRDEQGMYKFLSRKYGTNFTELRYCIINHRI